MSLTDNQKTIIENRYFTDDDSSWETVSQRVSDNILKYDKEYIDNTAEIIHNMYFLPGGRIIRNAGRASGSLLNCTAIPISDSIELIGKFLSDSIITWSSGSGVGTNLSELRPLGDPIKRKGGESSGPLSFLNAANACARTIQTGGQRRAAGLAMMKISHPDINRFISAKDKDGDIDCFNLSVGINEDFLLAVERNDGYDLRFKSRSYDKINARKMWDKIIDKMVRHAEPGLLNLDNLMSNNSYYYAPVITVNPCAEAVLEAYGTCVLGSVNMAKMVSNVNTNWQRFEKTIRLAVRFLDAVIDANEYALPEFKIAAMNGRRIGVGIMGVADYLFAKKIRYGSEKSIMEMERVAKFLRDVSYDESVKLSVEKGSFPKFDRYDYCKANFIKTLPASLRSSIKKNGIRNVSLMSLAPTGTISLVAGCTSGIEPLFSKAYRRNDRVGSRMYLHPMYEKAILENDMNVPDWFVDSNDLCAEDHLKMQASLQKYIDGAISKTIAFKKGVSHENVSELILEYIRDLKGLTIYVDGSRDGQPLNHVGVDEIREHVKNNLSTNEAGEEAYQCANGKCEI